MAFIQVQNYAVSISGLLSPPVYVNQLRITPLPFVGNGNAVDVVTMTYSADVSSGSVGRALGRLVAGNFPSDEFEVHWQIMQTESPVFIEWTEDPTNQPLLVSITLRTGGEPPGEGPADMSG